MSTEAGSQVKPKAIYTVRNDCRSCGHQLESVLSLGDQYLPRWVATIDKDLPHAPLELTRCVACGLLQLGHTVDPDLLFREFWYRTGINETMRTAMRDLVEEGVSWTSEGTWLDIGANDGYLLSQVDGESFHKVACEPALNFKTELEELADEVVSDYFSAACPPADVITSAACFYDVEHPDAFVADIARVLRPGGVWINQLNDSPTMLERNAFDSICHEHLLYYDVPALRTLYARHNLKIVDLSFNAVNGGSIRTVATWMGSPEPETDLIGLNGVSRDQAEMFARRTMRWRRRMAEVLDSFKRHGAVIGYGASTKGSVLLQYLDNVHIQHIADKNPRKIGAYVAGPWSKVISEEHMREVHPAALLVLPWAFRDEFLQREATTRAFGTAMIFPLPTIEIVV